MRYTRPITPSLLRRLNIDRYKINSKGCHIWHLEKKNAKKDGGRDSVECLWMNFVPKPAKLTKKK